MTIISSASASASTSLLDNLRAIVAAEPLNVEPRKVLLGAYVDVGDMAAARRIACELLDFAGVDDETRALCGSVLEADTLEVIPAASACDTLPPKPPNTTPVSALKPPTSGASKRRGWMSSSSSGRDPRAPTASELATVASMQRDADALHAEAAQLVQRGELLKSVLPNDTTLDAKLGRLRRLLG